MNEFKKFISKTYFGAIIKSFESYITKPSIGKTIGGVISLN